MTKRWSEEDKERMKRLVLAELFGHVGEENAIGMGELYELVFQESWNNRINDTRRIRRVITMLRWEGTMIASSSQREGGGYYIPRTKTEASEQIDRLTRRGLKPLAMAAKIAKVSLQQYLGQMALNLEGKNDDAA